MKKHHFFLFLLLLLASCNKDEGLGGSSSLEGYVYSVVHYDDNFSFSTQTFPALDKDVFLEFGDDLSVGERTKTGREGYYRFDYLRKGDYTVYALSSFADEHKAAVAKKIKVGGGSNQADTIFVHSGDAYGTAMIKGCVYAYFSDKNDKIIAVGPAINSDVYINHYGDEMFFERIRVGDQGFFIFQKILPGKYEVWVYDEADSRQLTPIKQIIEVDEAGKIYELPERFDIRIRS
jgi:hypothetical protein